MNADLKRVREGAALDDGSQMPGAKRRALSLSSPPVQETDDDKLEDWQRVVETHRKEAIYRHMLEYRRSYEGEARRARELEAQTRVLEASMRAVDICWAQVVTAMQDLAGRDESNVVDEQALEPKLQPGLATQELEAALHSRLPPTQQLISRFAKLASQGAVRPTAATELHVRCQKLQAESEAAQAQSSALKSEIQSVLASRDALQRDLLKAQKSLDRQRMDFDKVKTESAATLDRTRDSGSATPGPRPINGSGHATPNGHIDVKPLDNGNTNSILLPDTSEVEELAKSRLDALESLREKQSALLQEADQLRILAHTPSEAALRDSPFFQVYLHQLATQINRANALQIRADASEQKLDEIRNGNLEFQQLMITEAKAEVEVLRQAAVKKDADLARLRGQRDEATAEIAERRAKEAEKLRHGEQMEALANARQDRITTLVSECRRLKGRLGADAGASGYLAFLKAEGGIDGDYIKDLEEKLEQAQQKVASLSAELEATSGGSGHVELRIELDHARKRLDAYGKLIGGDPESTSESQELGGRLQKLDAEKTALATQLSEAEASINAMYSEIEILSKSCDDLDKVVHSKVFDLRDSELKMQRLITEKAKADNKYFAAMRQKESLDAECKTAQRSVEKQARLLERAQEVERNLNVQLAERDRGWTIAKNDAIRLQSELASITSERSQLELRLQQSQSSLSAAQQLANQRTAEASSEKASSAKLQEELEGAQRTIKKLKERTSALSGGGNKSSPEYQALLQEKDRLWQVLRCQCCTINLKQQAIVKCMHTFCKQCLDDRIASRQRRCPTCGTSFAKEDIRDMFWK